MAVGSEEFGDAQDAVRNAVDVGGKDSVMIATLMGHTVRYQPIAPSQVP